MSRWLLLLAFPLLTSLAGAQSGPRSYAYSGVVQPSECAKLPQKEFQIQPSLARSGSDDVLQIKCQKTDDGDLLLNMTFQLTDSPPPLARGESRRYSFRWGDKIGTPRGTTGEFTHDRGRCLQILELLERVASAKDPKIEPSWKGACTAEDRWGLVMEITLTESLR